MTRPASIRYLHVAIFLLLLGGCGLFDRDEADEFSGLTTEEQFYRRALEQLESRNYSCNFYLPGPRVAVSFWPLRSSSAD